MKKLFLILFLIFSSNFLFAQNFSDNKKIIFGLAGGENNAYFNVKSPDQYYLYTVPESVFSIGFNADIPLNDYFSIRPAIFYQGKGTEINELATYQVSDIYHLHYIEIPVDLIGHIPIGQNGANIFLGGGPFISYALSGNRRNENTKNVSNVTFGNSGDFKSTDFGATTVLGFQFAQGFAISMNLDFGLVNILQNSKLDLAATSAKTGVFYLCIGQSF